MKKTLCSIFVVLLSLSLLLVSCSTEPKANEEKKEEVKKETFTEEDTSKVTSESVIAGAAVASAVSTFKEQPCTMSVDIASTTDSSLSLLSDGSRTLRDTTAPESYKEIKLTYDIGAAVNKGLDQVAYKLSSGEDIKTFKRNAEEKAEKIESSSLYTEFKKLFNEETGELHFKGDILSRVLTEVKNCAPKVTVDILIGENGANGSLTVTAYLSGSGNDITVKVESAVLRNNSKVAVLSTEGAEFSLEFDDDFDVIFTLSDKGIAFSSIKGGVTVGVEKLTLNANALIKSLSLDVSGKVGYNFTTKKVDASLSVKGSDIDASFTVDATLSTKENYVSELVNGMKVTKLIIGETEFDADSVNSVLNSKKSVIAETLEKYLSGSSISIPTVQTNK